EEKDIELKRQKEEREQLLNNIESEKKSENSKIKQEVDFDDKLEKQRMQKNIEKIKKKREKEKILKLRELEDKAKKKADSENEQFKKFEISTYDLMKKANELLNNNQPDKATQIYNQLRKIYKPEYDGKRNFFKQILDLYKRINKNKLKIQNQTPIRSPLQPQPQPQPQPQQQLGNQNNLEPKKKIINDLLLEGSHLLTNNDTANAEIIYKKLKTSYDPQIDPDKQIYKRIVDFYKRLLKLKGY
ncbi:hypothetical protein GOV12_04560, partial [Candidatus Pacearchaeota archaeon]|nr:hypothetical protein [Candidatus Pacearchaeota archaeon]